MDSGLPSFRRAALPYPRRLIDALAILLTLGGIGWALDVYNRVGIAIYDQQYLAGMLAIALTLAFLKFPVRSATEKTDLPWYDAVAAVVVFAATGYLATFYPRIVDLIYLRQTDSVIVSVILIVLLIEALRRATGPVLPILVIVFILYALFANDLPGSGIPTDWRKLSLDARRQLHRHPRPAGQGRDHDRHRLRAVRPGAAAHRRHAVLHRHLDGADGPLPRRRGQDRGARLLPVRLDFRQRRRQRGGDRHRHHSADEARRRIPRTRPAPSRRWPRPAAS